MFTNTPIMYHSILSPPEMFRVRVQNVSHHDKQRALTLFATADYHLADNVLNPHQSIERRQQLQQLSPLLLFLKETNMNNVNNLTTNKN